MLTQEQTAKLRAAIIEKETNRRNTVSVADVETILAGLTESEKTTISDSLASGDLSPMLSVLKSKSLPLVTAKCEAIADNVLTNWGDAKITKLYSWLVEN